MDQQPKTEAGLGQEITAVSAEASATKKDTRFKPGVSGNPRGRPPSARAKIGFRQALMEQYVRGQIPAKEVLKVVEITFKDCFSPNPKVSIPNRKLVWEFFIQKPRNVEEVEDKSNGIVIRIENATFKATQADQPTVVDGEVIEVKDNG